jgi:hypothetical protein
LYPVPNGCAKTKRTRFICTTFRQTRYNAYIGLDRGTGSPSKSVAAGDGDRYLSTPLTRYYTEAGCPPGFWLGSGVHGLADGQLRPGDTVTEEQLELLLGMGRDPITGEVLGEPYRRFAGVADRVQGSDRPPRPGPDGG